MKVKINIHKSHAEYRHVLYGAIMKDDYVPGDPFDRFYIYSFDVIEVVDRVEQAGDAQFHKTGQYMFLYREQKTKTAIETELSEFFGVQDVRFCWDQDARQFIDNLDTHLSEA